ncbi:hypothetical protein ACFOSC_25925 [Streptantibioticus rubrisoli]|uniref:Uncharacterized protein n=1 Tax=Streptantibioticus rubrisoli TaxID=1387313 RepID=A0ABT1PLA9_9ACTN|nr:hypothetical protein [Streptantibioticus rubrisoli]MCQ4046144.1 hypothetical protein [Streptantibioticus rubrisoli]
MTRHAVPEDRSGPDSGPIVHGFPHLETIQASLTALYRRLSYDTISTFAVSVLPDEVRVPPDTDIYLGTQQVARSIVQHLRLPDARMIVAFRDMVHAGNVELEAGPEYFIELNSRFKEDRRDIGACLAHEVMHVYLHRLGLEFAGTRDNEILTDTASAYLGAGWLLLDAYREESNVRGDRLVRQACKLGYLTPEEFGYVLAKRALAFGDDIEPWFSSAQARDAYRAGMARAQADLRQPPLARCGWAGRRRYAADRRIVQRGDGVSAVRAGGYAFEGGSPLRVSFPCPTCHQRIRVPVRGRFTARCGVCGSELQCDT